MPEPTSRPKKHTPMWRSNQQLRQDIAELIDEVFIAARSAGLSGEDYLKTQWFEGHLYAAVNVNVYSDEEEHGALLLIVIFLNKIISEYQARAAQTTTPR